MDNLLGKKLAEVHSSRGLIFITILVRFCVLLFFDLIILGNIHSTNGLEEFFDMQAIIRFVLVIIAEFVFSFFPLIHIKDYIYFCENGICYGISFQERKYMFEEIFPVSWSYSGLLIPLLHYKNEMVTKRKNFNISYMRDVEKQFNMAYMNDMSSAKEG